MNDDPRWSSWTLAAAVAWAMVAVLMAGAWLVWVMGGPDAHHPAMLLATSGCATSAVAATLQIRTFASRICRLVRVTGGLERQAPAMVRQFTPRD